MYNQFPSRAVVELIRESYPKGSRVELVKMDDVQAPPIGTRGTVRGVDDAGSILVRWDNGSSLSVAYGEDVCKIINDEVVGSYNSGLGCFTTCSFG